MEDKLKLVQLGMPTQLAVEVSRQIESSSGGGGQALTVAQRAETKADAATVLANEADAAAVEALSAATAAAANTRDAKDLETLLANSTWRYDAPGAAQVVAGDVFRTRKEGFSYQAAASGASDHDLTTGGGLKLYVLPNADCKISLDALGADKTGAVDSAPLWRQAKVACLRVNGVAKLAIPSGVYRWNSAVDLSDTSGDGNTFSIEVGQPGYNRNGIGACINYYGPSGSICFTFGSSRVPQVVDGLSFRNYTPGAHGVAIFGARPQFRNFEIHNFDGIALRLGLGTSASKSCYYGEIENGNIQYPPGSTSDIAAWSGPVGAIGVWVTGGFPASNANTFRNVIVLGGYDKRLVIDGHQNRFVGGDLTYIGAQATSSLVEVNGNGNIIEGLYFEPGASGIRPNKHFVFGALASGNWIRDYYTTTRIQEADIVYGGYWNKVTDNLVLGVNYGLARRRHEGTLNLVQNGNFNGLNGSPSAASTPYGWMTFAATPWTRDADEKRGSRASVSVTHPGTATNLSLLQYIVDLNTGRARFNPVDPTAFAGKTLSFMVAAKASVAGRVTARLVAQGGDGYSVNNISSNSTHTGSGEWELLTGSIQCGPGGASEVYLSFNVSGGDALTAKYSAPVVTFGDSAADFDSAPLRTDGGMMSGRFSFAPPVTWGSGDATPSVSDANLFTTANASATTISNFDEGLPGQIIYVQAGDNNTTVANGANVQTSTNADKLLVSGRVYGFIRWPSKWAEVQV